MTNRHTRDRLFGLLSKTNILYFISVYAFSGRYNIHAAVNMHHFTMEN